MNKIIWLLGGREEMDAISAVGIFLHRFEKRGGWNTGDEAETSFLAYRPNRQKGLGAGEPHTRLSTSSVF